MIRIADLFAGIGGIRLGFEQAFGKQNVDCVFTSEIDKHAIETYKANFGDENIWGDITKIDSWGVPDHDILLAGFPCQPFSVVGLKRGFDDSKSGKAYFAIERILIAKRPKTFLLENVKGLKSADGGEIFRMIVDRLAAIGYKIFYATLSGKDFGVPQNRERIYIVGLYDCDANFQFPKPLNIPTRVGDILEKNVDVKYVLSDKKWNCEQDKLAKALKRIGDRCGFTYKIADESSSYTRTLTANYPSDCKNILIRQLGANPRKLTPRECARLQGFPDSFVIDKVSQAQIYKQLGNSVCVPVVRAIAEEIKKAFFELSDVEESV
jgi:DNA (cytosine-5)-methyltransferase 1